MSAEVKKEKTQPKVNLKGNPVAKEQNKGQAPRKEPETSLVSQLRKFRGSRSVGRNSK